MIAKVSFFSIFYKRVFATSSFSKNRSKFAVRITNRKIKEKIFP